MSTARLTSKGQLTVPRDVRLRLGIDRGDRVEFVEIEHGTFAIKAIIDDIRSLKGMLRPPQGSVSIADMNAAIRSRGGRP